MTDYAREPIAAIDPNSSTPFGEDKCLILDIGVSDGTIVDGDAVMFTSVTDFTVIQTSGAGSDAVSPIGIVLKDPSITKGTAIPAGRRLRVCVRGPVVARVTHGAGVNLRGGEALNCAAAGVLTGPATAAGYKCATLLDKRAADSVTAAEHIVYFDGISP